MFRFKFLDIYGGTIENEPDYHIINSRAFKVDEFSFDLYFNLRLGGRNHIGFEDLANLIDKVCLEINENFNTSQILIDDRSSMAATDIQIMPN